LDPVEPYFQGADKAVRLDTSDAAFVDVIHTDSLPFVKNKLGTHSMMMMMMMMVVMVMTSHLPNRTEHKGKRKSSQMMFVFGLCRK